MGANNKEKDKPNGKIIVLGILIILWSSISITFANFSNSCGNEVNVMLLNKTTLFMEKQPILFERTWSIIHRDIDKLMGHIGDLQEIYNLEISNADKQYQDFLYQKCHIY